MSRWQGKYLIGLTGNIATGKSVVRRMLEHLGAYTIDADALSHRAIAKDAPGFRPVVDAFGKFILDANGEIDRNRLGRLVFSDPEALKALESIIHPLVHQAIDLLVRRASQRVVVIEAIKLLEGDLASACDAIWVTDASEAIQKSRLVMKRSMPEKEALQRIQAQAPQKLKTAAAKVIIHNSGSFEDTWEQVVAAWKVISPQADTIPTIKRKSGLGELTVQRGRPRDSAEIAAFISKVNGGRRNLNASDIMAEFCDKAFLLLYIDHRLSGLAAWQVENLVARTIDLLLDSDIPAAQGIKELINEVENGSRDLQCEASLIFPAPNLAGLEDVWKDLGYVKRTPQTLGVQAWQDAAHESQPANTELLFKQLRQDRVLRPI